MNTHSSLLFGLILLLILPVNISPAESQEITIIGVNDTKVTVEIDVLPDENHICVLRYPNDDDTEGYSYPEGRDKGNGIWEFDIDFNCNKIYTIYAIITSKYINPGSCGNFNNYIKESIDYDSKEYSKNCSEVR